MDIDIQIDKMWCNSDSFYVNIWSKFVNVSHLWAALGRFEPPRTYGTIPVIRFDELVLASGECCDSPLLKFIEISNEYLKIGTMRSQGKPLINKNKAIQIKLFLAPE